MFADSWAGTLLCLSRLDTGFLICTNDPDALFEQGCGVFIQLQNRTSTIEKLLRFLDVLEGDENARGGSALLGASGQWYWLR
jgi:hypothetical protein